MIAPVASTSGIQPLAVSQINVSDRYYLYDDFTTARAAGAVNGTLAEPVGVARNVIDANNKISISGGLINFATGAVQFDGVWYSAIIRRLGIALMTSVTPANTNGSVQFGWDTNTSGAVLSGARLISGGTISALSNGGLIAVGAYSVATMYQLCSVMRATLGTFLFVKGGAFTNWTLMYFDTIGAADVPSLSSANSISVYTADNIRIPKRLYIPVPLQSDGMSAAITDGLGNPENNGTAGNAYTNIGTWGIAAGKRSCSALSGGLGFSYLACSSSNVIIEAVCTRSAGVTGLVARYADASNYLIAYHDGANAKLDKVVAGVTTNLLTAVVAYSATTVIRLHLDGTSARLFYAGAVGTVAVTPAAGSLNHGLYTTNINATFDNLVIWARGNSETQYEDLNLL